MGLGGAAAPGVRQTAGLSLSATGSHTASKHARSHAGVWSVGMRGSREIEGGGEGKRGAEREKEPDRERERGGGGGGGGESERKRGIERDRWA